MYGYRSKLDQKGFNMKMFVIIAALFAFDCYATEGSKAIPSEAESVKASSIQSFLGENYVPRSSWGKVAVNYMTLEQEGNLSLDELKEIASLHHTVTGSKYSSQGNINLDDEFKTVEEVEKLHIDTFKFADVGYHYMIGQSGKVYEGRPLQYTGSHTGGLNSKNAGIAFIGCYDDKGCPKEGYNVTDVTDEMIESAANLIAYLSVNQGLVISPETIIPRSLYDVNKKGQTKFPYSPGNRIIEVVEEIVKRSLSKLESVKATPSV